MANLKFDLQNESYRSILAMMLFAQRFRLNMFCLFPLSEPYNSLADGLYVFQRATTVFELEKEAICSVYGHIFTMVLLSAI